VWAERGGESQALSRLEEASGERIRELVRPEGSLRVGGKPLHPKGQVSYSLPTRCEDAGPERIEVTVESADSSVGFSTARPGKPRTIECSARRPSRSFLVRPGLVSERECCVGNRLGTISSAYQQSESPLCSSFRPFRPSVLAVGLFLHLVSRTSSGLDHTIVAFAR
jgi:hypothetical protein